MNKYKRLGKNSLLIFIGSIGSKMLAVLMLPFYTAWLSSEKYGDVDLVNTYVSLFMGLVTLCMTDAIFRFPQGKTEKEQGVFFSSDLAVSGLSLGVFGILYFLVLYLFNSSSWGVISKYSVFIFLFMTLNFLQLYLQQFSRSIDRMKVFVINGIIVTSFTAGISFWLVPKYGVDGFLISQLFGCLSASLYTLIAIRGRRFFSLTLVDKDVIKEMLRYSVPMIPNATLWWILGASNRLFLEYYQSVESVGIFAVSNRFPSLITMVFNTLFLSWQISALEEYQKPDFPAFYNRIIRLCFLCLIVLSIGLTISSYWLIKVFTAPDYISAWFYIPFLGLAAVFSSMSVFAGTMFMAVKKTKYFLTTSLWGGIVCVGLNFALIPHFGILGASISLLAAHYVIFHLRIYFADRYVELTNKSWYAITILVALALSLSMMYIDVITVKAGVITLLLFFYLWRNRVSLKSAKNMLLKSRVKNED